VTARIWTRSAWAVLACASLSLASCSAAYYGAMEKMGYEKRHILVDRVEDGREAQEQAQKQFQTALEAFKAVSGFQGGELEAKYNELNAQYQSCEKRADEVRSEIASIDKVATDLFAEWSHEIDEMQNANLKRDSRAKLASTQQQYAKYIAAMRKSETKMEPVLVAFKDQVLYLKHNLNAQAIGSLQGNVGAIEKDVESLVREMQKAITEADQFLATVKS
jgi:Protein of unknown function (DUF2959)